MVELLIGLVLAMFLTAAMLVSYTFLVRSLIRSSNQQQLEAQSRRTLQILTQDVHLATDVQTANSSHLALSLPYVHADGSVTYYTITYDSTAGNLVRTVSGTPPPNVNSNPLTLLTGVSNLSFNFFDQKNLPATNILGIKQIEVSNFTISSGSAITGTQANYIGASARLILRNNHLVTVPN